MKNTFAVTMTLLLALTLGGSLAGYRLATAPEEEKKTAEAPRPVSESAPSPSSAATGAAGAAGVEGNVKAANAGGTQGGENGAVAASSDRKMTGTPGASMAGTSGDSATGGASQADSAKDDPAGATGQPPADRAAAAEPQGDATAGGKTFAGNCAGCHGANGAGNIGPALTTADGPKSWTLAQFTTTLREGKTPQRELNATMPRFSPQQLTDSDIANVFAYVKTLN